MGIYRGTIFPAEDGLSHLNVYSKGKTVLGRFLTNFTYAPMETADGPFDSVEGYWYWLSTGDDRLRKLSGYAAKKLGRSLHREKGDPDEFKAKICLAIATKLNTYPEYLEQLYQCTLPLTHYYVYGGTTHEPKEFRWIIEFIDSLRE